MATAPPRTDAPRSNPIDDSRDVVRLVEDLRAWQRPDFGGVARFRGRDVTYWREAGRLVMEYFYIQAGPRYTEALWQGFVGWLRDAPDILGQYEEGDDMARAALVDQYLFETGERELRSWQAST